VFHAHACLEGGGGFESGSDDGDLDGVSHVLVDHGAEQDVGVVVGRLVDDGGGVGDLVQGQVETAGDVDQHAAGAVYGGVLEQGAGNRRDGCLGGAALTALGGGSHDRHAHPRHHGAYVGEIEVDEAGHQDQVGNALHALVQHHVGHREGLHQRRVAGHRRQQAVVGNRDQRVDGVLQFQQALVGLLGAAAALESERAGDHGDGERAELGCQPRNHRCGAGGGAAAEAAGDEHHVGALEHVDDLFGAFQRCLAADLGVGAGSQATRQAGPELQLLGCIVDLQGLQVGVCGDEVDALQPCLHHPADGVAAAAADPHDLDVGAAQHRLGELAERGRGHRRCVGLGARRCLFLGGPYHTNRGAGRGRLLACLGLGGSGFGSGLRLGASGFGSGLGLQRLGAGLRVLLAQPSEFLVKLWLPTPWSVRHTHPSLLTLRGGPNVSRRHRESTLGPY